MPEQKLSASAELVAIKRDAILSVLPKAIDAERFYGIALSIANSSDLSNCTPISVAMAIFGIAKLGLDPDPARQHVCVVPYKGKAQVQVEYRGWQHLARNTRRIADIHAEVIYENERHEVHFGTERRILHQPWYSDNVQAPGNLKLAYVTWTDVDSGNREFHVVGKERIERAKKASASAKSNYSPWQTDEAAMWKKTAIIDAARFWPTSTELAEAIRWEQQAEVGEEQALPSLDTGMSIEEAQSSQESLAEYVDPENPLGVK